MTASGSLAAQARGDTKGSTFTIERQQDSSRHGDLPSLRTLLHNLFESQSDEAPAVHIFDLTGVLYMDSAGLGMIVSQYVRCKSEGLRMVAAGMSPRVLELFKLTQMDTFIPMDAAIEEAEAHSNISRVAG